MCVIWKLYVVKIIPSYRPASDWLSLISDTRRIIACSNRDLNLNYSTRKAFRKQIALQGSHQACEGQGTEEGSDSHLVTPQVKPRGWRQSGAFGRACLREAAELSPGASLGWLGGLEHPCRWTSGNGWVSMRKNPLTLLCTNCNYQLSVFGAREDFSFWKYGPHTVTCLKNTLLENNNNCKGPQTKCWRVSFKGKDKETRCALAVRHGSKAGKASPAGLFYFCGNFADIYISVSELLFDW